MTDSHHPDPAVSLTYGEGVWLASKVGVVVSVLTSVCAVLPVFLTGALAVEMRRTIGLSVSELGLAVSLYYVAASLTAAAAGRLIQSRGTRFGLIAALVASTTSCVLVAGVVDSTPMLSVSMLIGGMGNAFGASATSLLIAETVPPRKQGIAFGIRQSSIPSAVALAGIAVPTVALTLGWRWAFAIAAAITASGLVAVSLIPSTRRPPRDRAGSEIGVPFRSLVFLGAGIGLGSMAVSSLAAFFVESAVRSGIELKHAGLLLALGSALGIAVRLAGGWMADQRQQGRLAAVALMLLGGSLGMSLMALKSSVWIIPGMLLAFGPGFGWTGLYNLAIVVMNPDAPARATGITQTGAYLGGALGPFLFGAIADNHGFSWAWSGAAVCSALGAAAVLATRSAIRRSAFRQSMIRAEQGAR